MNSPRSLRCQCGAHLIFYWVQAGTPPTVHIDTDELMAAQRTHRC